jgi:hypothetical protein
LDVEVCETWPRGSLKIFDPGDGRESQGGV